MRIVQPAMGPGNVIDRYGSAGAQRLGGVRFDGSGGLTFITLTAGGHLGRHPAPLAQLFCVVRGEGWVSGDDGSRVAIAAGEAAVWESGEQHESGTDSGMTVAVLEASSLETSDSAR